MKKGRTEGKCSRREEGWRVKTGRETAEKRELAGKEGEGRLEGKGVGGSVCEVSAGREE